MDDFRAFMSEQVPESRRTFDWHDPKNDPDGKYLVDCRVNGMARPVFVYALPTRDDKVRDATITLLQLERWGLTDLRQEHLRKSDHLNPLRDIPELERRVRATGAKLGIFVGSRRASRQYQRQQQRKYRTRHT